MVLLLRFWMLISLLGWDTVKLSVLGLGLMWVLLKWVMVLEMAGALAGNGAAGQGNAAGGRLQWTNVMSAFVLRWFTDLVGEGVRTDKGFKDVHLNAIARDL
jgi:hypothetical protein